ncbi:MAG: DUF6338 family protein [Thermoanaerobaculia bacterium]
MERMKKALSYVARTLVTGLLIVVPVYLAVLLVLKGMKSVVGLVRPVAALLPDSIPAEALLSLLLVLLVCFLAGVLVRTRAGQAAREKAERSLFERIPGYSVIRSLTQQLAGSSAENVWKPALVQTDEGLVPAFVIEELADGRYTVFIPSIPTPLAGAVMVLERRRVHPLDVPFTEALRVVSRWGSGAKDLVAAMERADSTAK